MAASQCACEVLVLFMRGLYGDMGNDLSKPTTIYVDNSGAIPVLYSLLGITAAVSGRATF